MVMLVWTSTRGRGRKKSACPRKPPRPNTAPIVVQRERCAASWPADGLARQHGVDTRDILIELGNRRMVGGQEDMIVDVALDMIKERDGGDATGKGE